MPPAKFKKGRDKSDAAMRRRATHRLFLRWEVNDPEGPWEPELEPTITPMLASVEGGIPRCIQALRAHDDEDAGAFLEMYDGATATDRRFLKIEEIAHAAGIGSLRLAEVVQTALFLYGNMQTQMMLAAGLPGIVATSIRQAKKVKGLADREWMLKAGKILPIPKGAQTAIQINAGPVEKEESEPETHEWKWPEDRTKQIMAVINPKQLEASASLASEQVHFDQSKPVVFEKR